MVKGQKVDLDNISHIKCVDFTIQVRIMRKRLVRKTFDLIQEISENENKEVRKSTLSVIYLHMLKYFFFKPRITRNSGRTLGSY